MKDMFYNYDNHIVPKKDCHCINNNSNTILESYSNLEYIVNIKNEIIGIKCHKNSPLKLQFNFAGDVNGEEANLIPFLKENVIKFEILNTQHEVLAKSWTDEPDIMPEILISTIKGNSIFIYWKNQNLKADIYKMHLFLETADEIYNLFSETDGFLSIV